MAKGLTLHQYALHLAEAPAELQERLHGLALDLVDRLETQGRDLASSRLKVRSRSLLTSIRADLMEQAGAFTIKFAAGGDYEGLRVRYARLQEEGGTIRPVNAGALTIPQEPALTGPGIPKYPSASQAPRLALVKKTRAGGFIVISRDGQRLSAEDVEALTKKIKGEVRGAVLVQVQTGEIWYVLARKVTVPAHWYMRDAFREVSSQVPAELAAVMREVA